MKKKLTVIICITLLTLCIGIAITSQSNALPIPQLVTKLDKVKTEKQGIHLDAPLVNNASISSQTAIENAKKEWPVWAESATTVTAEYQLVTNRDFKLFSKEALDKNPELHAKGFLDKQPVYIVSFRGISIQSHQDFLSKEKDTTIEVRNEGNVIIDAATGVPLMAFSNR